MNYNKSKELPLGLSIGLVCLTDEASTIVCTLCASRTEFGKLLNLISHIAREHGCTSGSEFNLTKKIKSEVIDLDLFEKCKDPENSSERACPKDNLQGMDSSMFTVDATQPISLKKTQQELDNEINMNMVKSENDTFSIVEICPREFYCHNNNTNIVSGKKVVNNVCRKISPTFADTVRVQNKQIHTNEGNYNCEICNKIFSTLRGFRTHYTRIHQKTHQDATKLFCGDCNTNFSFENEQLTHICTKDASSSVDLIEKKDGTSLTENNNTYDCKICYAKLKTASTLQSHIMTHNSKKPFKFNSDEKTFKCDDCNCSYNTSSELRHHIKKTHSENTLFGKEFRCELCPAILKSQQNLKHHISQHKEDKPFKCPQCSRAYCSSNNLNRHMVTHSGKKSFKCENCSSAFYSSDKLKRHMLSHTGKKEYKCEHCSRAFNRSDYLKSHMVIHTGNKPYKCEQCSHAFSILTNLERHMAARHASLGKEFRCAFCPAILKSQQNLNLHVLKHKGDKPFKCELCSRAYYSSNNLKLHIAKHSGNKPFKCEQCSRTFYCSYTLKRHMVTHSGKKSYECEQCSRSFYLPHELKRHMLMHSRIKPNKYEQYLSSITSDSPQFHMEKYTEIQNTNVEIDIKNDSN